ncbi:MAG: DUF427 domain-containing protein [Acidobacteria bacterium]|nr:DUF427 domain-containing protein [Acidobacteriota bacterium]
MKATWNGAILAESDRTVVVEGNHYFPAASIKNEHFRPSQTHTTCPWKGEASYYDIVVGEQVNKDAAWYYPNASEAARHIQDHVAFWKGVQIGS